MRAAVIERIGEAPRLAAVDEPSVGAGQALVEVTAAAINPVDLSIADGRFFAGVPDVPYTPGREGVGRVVYGDGLAPGTRVWFELAGGLGGGGGSFCERVAVDEAATLELTDDIDDAAAVSLGIAGITAWLAVEWRGMLRPGESVLVLAATGPVGALAIQAARLLGASRVVAAARDIAALETARELGADALVAIDPAADASELATRFGEGAQGTIDLVIDPLWGQPAAAATIAASRHGRIVHLGQSADPKATFDSGMVRGKALSILGLSMPIAPQSTKQAAYQKLLHHAERGEIKIDHEVLSLSDVTCAWHRQRDFPRRKLVLTP